MATASDIDTVSAVSKFLQQSTVVNKEDPAADSSTEVDAILQSIALSFLLYPQAALSFVLTAKNILQQVVGADLQIINYLLKALGEVSNPSNPISNISSLIDAQTALIEVDKVGRVSTDVSAYSRYTSAINKFLDQQLGSSVKRNNTGEFERTGIEAKQDLFRVLSAFGSVHNVAITRMNQLVGGIDDFQSVDLTRIVSTFAISNVRTSLTKVIQGVQNQSLSNTAAAIELLAGAASLQSVSNTRKVYDPTVDTGLFPAGRTITVSSETVAAKASGTSSSVSLQSIATPWVFSMTTDPEIGGGTSYAITIPASSASGRSYVKASSGSSTYNITSDNCTLYVQFDGITPPTNYAATVAAVTLPVGGAVTVSAILAALNNVSTGLINGTAVEMGNTGRIMIYGSSSVTRIVVLSGVPGAFDGLGIYSYAPGSVHKVLGFRDEQTSGDPNVFSPDDMADILGANVPTATFSTDDRALTIQSNSTDLLSSLSFTGTVAQAFGLSGSYEAEPTYLQLYENDTPIDPVDLGVFLGSVIYARDVLPTSFRVLANAVTGIAGTELTFGVTLPRCSGTLVKVVSPLVFKVQSLLDALRPLLGTLDNDSLALQQALAPILSTPSLAQLGDAKTALTKVKTKLVNLQSILVNVTVEDDHTSFGAVADQIVEALQERSLDRGLDLLQSCQFSSFFALTGDTASKGTRFLKSVEAVGSNDLASTTVEQNQDDLTPKGVTPNSNILTGEELPDTQEQQ